MLCEEVINGNKGKNAIIIGWCTKFTWNELLRLGATTGGNPIIDKERLHMLPFLNCSDGRLGTVKTQYDFRESEYKILGKEAIINWRLYGQETDDFNIVLFW